MGNKKVDVTTEEKIKEAARTIFHRKGYAATRTRDIAEEANINLALLNYYFRSKKKLFDIIMLETVSEFFQSMIPVLNDENSSLDQKVKLITSNYIGFITEGPNLPIFMLSEIRYNVDGLLEKLPIKPLVMNSIFLKQYQEAVTKGKIAEPNPLQFLINLLSLIIFPFIAKPLLQEVGEVDDTQFDTMMQERRELIPVWVKAMIRTE
ncbi:MAG: TetR family transcriptional regulator [Bacteroidales bacterium]|jgi:AcrR family transcriptional regulator|nr:TetR family transcriptional regulator [Bacteroidales bacterium]MDD3701079.1 TetR family transcriptional regulator [Bacteroidales bacterium]MDY0369283.1 TetR family transcriptional regulator [Bacteroidales bacterium]